MGITVASVAVGRTPLCAALAFAVFASAKWHSPAKSPLKVLLRYTKGESAIQGIQRVSTPGLRHYVDAAKLPRVRNGLGYAIISTSKGVMTDHEARKENVGGEVIAKVWYQYPGWR